jgi:hypothetical protein
LKSLQSLPFVGVKKAYSSCGENTHLLLESELADVAKDGGSTGPGSSFRTPGDEDKIKVQGKRG